MFSGLFSGMQSNNLLPCCFSTSAHSFGNIIFAPIHLENLPLFIPSPYFSQPNEAQAELVVA